VYNTRRGVPPDIPKILTEKQRQYPKIKIEEMSSDALWEIARELTMQQRAEVLGAPIGYEKLFVHLESDSLPDTEAMPSIDSRIVLIQDTLNPIDISSVVEALKPSCIFGAPVFLRPDMSSWETAASYQKSVVLDLLEKCRHTHPPRFAVFSLAPIPLITQLGFLLTYSVSVRYFKFHVDTQSWLWPVVDEKELDLGINVIGLPDEIIIDPCDAVIRVSLSAKVGRHEPEEVVPNAPVQIDISVANPNLTWLRSEKQVQKFGQVFRNVLAEIREKVSNCKNIHLFLAGAAPIALVAGQQINPRMNLPVRVYEYSRQTHPRYQYTFTLHDT
jgi:hypothetical protein